MQLASEAAFQGVFSIETSDRDPYTEVQQTIDAIVQHL
jgi:hypothetical protein